MLKFSDLQGMDIKKACRLGLIPDRKIRRKPRDPDKLRILAEMCRERMKRAPLELHHTYNSLK